MMETFMYTQWLADKNSRALHHSSLIFYLRCKAKEWWAERSSDDQDYENLKQSHYTIPLRSGFILAPCRC